MKTHPSVLDPVGEICAAVRVVGLVGAVLTGLGGCADTHWERALYQGARYGNDQCQIQRRPADPPCAELADYARYEQERAKAKTQNAPSAQPPAIEEKQL